MASIQHRGKSWRAMVRLKGGTTTRTFDTEAEAADWAAAKEADIKTKTSTPKLAAQPAPVAPPESVIRVEDLFREYGRRVSPLKGGERWEVIRLTALAKDFPMPINQVNAETFCEWRDRRLRKVSGSTVGRELTLMSAVFSKGIKEWGLLKKGLLAHPIKGIDWPKQNRERSQRISDVQRDAILKQLGWDQSSRPATLNHWVAWGFCFALETMMRRGEILGMTWNNVHARFVHLPVTKNDDKRSVPLSKRALALLELLTRGHPDAKVVPMNMGTFSAYFAAARKAAGCPEIHFHDTRRESITRNAHKFSDSIELARVTGHREVKTLMIYFKPSMAELADKLDAD